MIPASYLYKDAYKQHWGEDFARRSGEAPWEAHPDAGLWEKPSLWRNIAGLAGRLFGASRPVTADETEASGRRCPEATDRNPALPA
jgi:hypothetical protein